MNPWPSMISRRYRVLGLLGHGGMGTVFQVADRLDGEVALKRLHRAPGQTVEHAATLHGGAPTTRGSALSLAHEFRTLASLRHPNIISVRDYGFDEERRPFLTMDLLPGGRTIVAAGRDRSEEQKVALLAQMLRALAYLHRRGILHRDLKPANVLVVDDQVKVLDFGIAIERDQRAADTAGTPGYLAPEVLAGEPASERADLYAVGVIAHELFTGRHPHDARVTTDAATARGVSPGLAQPPLEVEMPNHGLGAIVRRLLATEPEARFASAEEVLAALAQATGLPVAIETAATRESFLQAARFVGRVHERAELERLLDAALAGRGGACLLAGESGVGKSRLLGEVRALAMVRGADVLRGQEERDGGPPYEPWRNVLRTLALFANPSELEASVLRPLVPDIAQLTEHAVAAATDVDLEMEQARLHGVIEDLLLRQRRPLVIMLEDLHWSGSETLKLLARLSQVASRAPLLILGTYRDDERPELPSQLPSMKVLRLPRLSTVETSQLAESILGGAARDPELIAALQRETEGNPFFLVEVVRSLAEQTGQLDRVGPRRTQTLPRGVHEVVERRLDRVPPQQRPLLELAAVLGRQLDLKVLAALAPETDLDAWIHDCADASVLDFDDGRWRFAHDKLRERQLSRLAVVDRPAMHRRVAEAIEHAWGEAMEQSAVLAYHWARAGDEGREAHYAERAGEVALRAGANREALHFFRRAIAIVGEQALRGSAMGGLAARLGLEQPVTPTSPRGHLGRLEALTAEACFQLGDFTGCRSHAEEALRCLGRPMPSSSAGWAVGTVRQVVERALQSLRPSLFREHSEGARQVRYQAGRLQARLTDLFIFSGESLPVLWSGLRTLNLCEPAGSSPELARGYSGMAVVAGTVTLHRVAKAWSRRALEVAEEVGTPGDLAYVLVRNAVYAAYLAHWSDVERWIEQAIAVVDRVADFRLAEEARVLLALSWFYQGKFNRIPPLWDWVEGSARRRGALQWEVLAQMNRAMCELRLGRPELAWPHLEIVAATKDRDRLQENQISWLGCRALLAYRSGRVAETHGEVRQLVEVLRKAKPVAHWNQMGTAMGAEVCLALWEDARGRLGAAERRRDAMVAVKAMSAFGKVFPFGRPFALLFEGCAAWLDGREGEARRRWHEGLTAAAEMATPFEEGLLHLELGRRAPASDPVRRPHLTRAVEIFELLGTAREQALARHLLG